MPYHDLINSLVILCFMDRPVGRVGSKNLAKLAGRVGSGHAFTGSGRVGSQNLDPRATLKQIPRQLLLPGQGHEIENRITSFSYVNHQTSTRSTVPITVS